MSKSLKYIVLSVAVLLIGLVLVRASEKQSFKSAYKEKNVSVKKTTPIVSNYDVVRLVSI